MPIVTVLLKKSSRDVKSGIRLATYNNHDVRVVDIDPTGPLASTLTKGDQILAVNDTSCTDHKQTAEMIRDAIGDVKLSMKVANNMFKNRSSSVVVDAEFDSPSKPQGVITVSFKKESADLRLGVRLAESQMDGAIRVADIDHMGPLSDALVKDDQIISINGEYLDSSEQGQNILRLATGDVKLLIRPTARSRKARHNVMLGVSGTSSPAPTLFTDLRPPTVHELSEAERGVLDVDGEVVKLVFEKPAPSSKVGLCLADSSTSSVQGGVEVAAVDVGGPLASLLSAGDQILSICGENAHTQARALQILKAASGDVELLIRRADRAPVMRVAGPPTEAEEGSLLSQMEARGGTEVLTARETAAAAREALAEAMALLTMAKADIAKDDQDIDTLQPSPGLASPLDESKGGARVVAQADRVARAIAARQAKEAAAAIPIGASDEERQIFNEAKEMTRAAGDEGVKLAPPSERLVNGAVLNETAAAKTPGDSNANEYNPQADQAAPMVTRVAGAEAALVQVESARADGGAAMVLVNGSTAVREAAAANGDKRIPAQGPCKVLSIVMAKCLL